MIELVAAEEEALEVELGERAVGAGEPARHAVVVSVFGLGGELLPSVREAGEKREGARAEGAVGADVRERGVALRDQVEHRRGTRLELAGRAIGESNEIVVEE